MKNLILASSSPARKELLQRLGLSFLTISPEIDEGALFNEKPKDLVLRLAVEKAMVHRARFANALIIGSDQVAVINDEIVGKPGTHDQAVAILQAASGQTISFFTGLCLFNTETQNKQIAIEQYDVTYRVLTLDMIENYLNKEQPYQCAGSIKVEGLGIALMKQLSGTDPTTLTGLPLIRLVAMLEQEGCQII